jgi:hypothetical protein
LPLFSPRYETRHDGKQDSGLTFVRKDPLAPRNTSVVHISYRNITRWGNLNAFTAFFQLRLLPM